MRARLTKLERTAERISGGACRTCFSKRPGGVSEMPLVIMEGKPREYHMWGPDQRCVKCGAAPAGVVIISFGLGELEEPFAADDEDCVE